MPVVGMSSSDAVQSSQFACAADWVAEDNSLVSVELT
jgi:hypothetical protein